MSYYFTKILNDINIDQAISVLSSELSKEGFGILSEIKVDKVFKKKINKEIRPYRILGACHAEHAFAAITHENKIGTMLPCNFIVQELESGSIEISAVDPAAAMSSVENTALVDIAHTIRNKIISVINHL